MQVTELASRYAQALFEVVQESDKQSAAFEQLRGLEKIFWSDLAVRSFFANPSVPQLDKEKMIRDVLGKDKVESCLVDFLIMLVERKRLPLFGQICEAFRKLTDDQHKMTRGEVFSATPLSAEQRKRLEETVSRVAGKSVVLTYRQDPNMIGGLQAKVGSLLFDDSIDTHLNRLKEKLI